LLRRPDIQTILLEYATLLNYSKSRHAKDVGPNPCCAQRAHHAVSLSEHCFNCAYFHNAVKRQNTESIAIALIGHRHDGSHARA
jgi:hypothetical protein